MPFDFKRQSIKPYLIWHFYIFKNKPKERKQKRNPPPFF
ncbi:Hypothetical protein HPV225_1197 [Helicobacter pylori v225d]|nr:Hypothetical protein HPV225_1197 [Helicobacter pylori v225d]